MHAAQTLQWGAMQVTPHLSAAWQHAFDDVTPDAGLTFAATGIGFTVTAGVSYSGQFGDHAIKGRFTWLF